MQKVANRRVSYLFDTARVNANTIYNINQTPTTSWIFGVELARQLVMPHVKRRSVAGLSKSLRQKIELFTGEPADRAQVLDSKEEYGNAVVFA